MTRNPGAQVGAVLLASSGAIHLALAGAHATSPSHAVFFAAVGAALVAVGPALTRPATRRTERCAMAGAGVLVALYAATRVTAVPLAGPPEPVDAIGLFTKALELAAIVAISLRARDGVGAAAPQLPRRRRTVPAMSASLAGAAALVGLPVVQAAPALAVTTCPTGTRAIAYDVVAMKVDIVLNNFGDHNPNGLMYALASEEASIRAHLAANPGKPGELVRPLVIRANQGDCVKVTLTNKLARPAGFHAQGLAYDIKTDDGSYTGDNPDSLVPAGGTRTYTYWVPDDEEEGTRLVEDLGDPRGSGPLVDDGVAHTEGGNNQGSMSQGLYGALNVEPKGSTWTDQETGADLLGQAHPHADIHLGTNSDGNDFREYTLIGWDETEVKTKDGLDPIEHNGAESSFFGFNYRYEPHRNRVKNPVPEASSTAPDTGDGEELLYSSWAHGDPATPVVRGYKGDPAKIRILMAGTKETHVFHLHQHRWRNEPKDPNSTRIDSQSWSPGQSYTLDLEGGVGSQTGSAGDSIFHCHLYPHFFGGFWGLLRSHDVLEDGTRHYPDGSVTPPLQPLPDRPLPPAPSTTNPGFPHFIPGAIDPSVQSEYPDGRSEKGFGHRPPQTPMGPVQADGTTNDRRGPFDTSWRTGGTTDAIPALTPAEEKAFTAKLPGAPFVNPCTANAPVRTYDISLIQTKIVYNSDGWHDPYGRLYVLTGDEAAVRNGTKQPEPLAIRANVGECVELTFRNKLPVTVSPSAFQSALTAQEAGIHPHLVKFDLLASDGSTNGWNYDQAVLSGQVQRYRWMVDVPIRTAFFHDHAFAGVQQQHGVFGALLQEPKGSTWRDPKTGDVFGTRGDGGPTSWRADILDPNGPDHREFSLFVQDFAPVFDSNGNEVNPPAIPDDPDDYGVAAISYRNEPFKFRRKWTSNGRKWHDADPAYVYSSKLHGDPDTPLMEAYRKDHVRMRIFQGSFEEQHTLSIHGARWRFEPDDPTSELRSAQSFGLSEAFNLEAPTFENCGSQACKGDYLYRVNDKDSLWLGAWGLFRVHKFKQDGKSGRTTLLELPDQANKPPADTNNVDNDSTQTCGDGLGGFLGAITCVVDSNTGLQKPPDSGKEDFCPSNAPVRRYEVVAMQTPLKYNAHGDSEDVGLIYALAADEAAIRGGTKKPEPLMIRANAGECVEMVLTNKLPTTLPGRTLEDPRFEVDERRLDGTFDWGPSTRASIHASGLLKYEVNGSDGAVVGKNGNTTIAPGESITQHWYADQEVGSVLLEDLGDQLNHRFRGLFAGLVVEPAGAKHLDPITGAPISSGTQALIADSAGTPLFREFGLFLQDGLTTLDAKGTHPMGVDEEAEDGGDKGFNYRSAPFSRRLTDPANPSTTELAHVFSTTRGCPDTPIWQAVAGDAVRVRLFGSQDQRRQQSVEVVGHRWPQEPGGTGTVWRNSQDALGAGIEDDLHLTAGGSMKMAGDYRYGSTIYWRHREGGQWGLFRVLPSVEHLKPEPCDRASTPPPPIGGTTTAASPAAPTTWTATTGSTKGDVSVLKADDAAYLNLVAAKHGKKYTTDGYGSYTAPPEQRNVVGLKVAYDGGATATGATRTLSLYNFTTAAWESLESVKQPTADLGFTAQVSGDPKRFVSSTGELRMRAEASSTSAFELKADLMAFTVTYQQ